MNLPGLLKSTADLPLQEDRTTNLQRILSLANKTIWMAGLAAFAYFGHGNDSFVQDVWTAAKTASPFAAMLAILLFFDERRERREAQRQCNERTLDFVQANHTTSAALEKLAQSINRRQAQK